MPRSHPEGCLIDVLVDRIGDEPLNVANNASISRDSIFIQRWWNHGIREAVHLGAAAVATYNDDITINSQTLSRLHEELRESGVAIASPSRQGTRLGLHKEHLVPYLPILWDCLWVLDTKSLLRPDEIFPWWIENNDLDSRVHRGYTRIESVHVEFTHEHSGQNTGASHEFRVLTDADNRTYETKSLSRSGRRTRVSTAS